MNQEQWDELKRLHAKLPCEHLTFGTEQICELNASGSYSPIAERVSAREVDQFMAYMQFFTTFHNAFPQILAEREAAQRLRDAVANWITIDCPAQIGDALAAFDKESKND